MKIGIITWHQYHNFGSALQAYALSKACSEISDYVKIIDYQKNKKMGNIAVSLRCIVGKIFDYMPYKFLPNKRYSYLRFHRWFFNLTDRVHKEELKRISSEFDVVICGSDQIWAPNVLDTSYMLDFIDDKSIKKISYAASIGLPQIPDSLLTTYKTYLSQLDTISIREEAGQKLLEKNFNIRSEVVLDPTLLLDRKEYELIEVKLRNFHKKYIFCYFLNKNHEYRDAVERYAKESNLKIVGVSAREEDSEWLEILKEIGPREFLWLVHNSDAVFTDSYHGMIFSLIYNKTFFAFERFKDDDPINQNSRIYQLDKWFEVEKRFLTNGKTTKDCSELDYDKIEEKIKRERERSKSFLRRALQ